MMASGARTKAVLLAGGLGTRLRPLTETVQLGNVATRIPGKALEWDAAALRITNEEAANPLLTKIYRDGWKIEAVG